MLETLTHDRTNFLHQLWTKPIFLLKHAPSLYFAVKRKLKIRLATRFNEKHQGSKRWPEWLEPRYSTLFPEREPGVRRATIAAAQFRPHEGVIVRTDDLGNVSAILDGSDPENYLAENRWGFLSEALSGRTLDHQQLIERVKQWIECNSDKKDMAWETYSACERISNLIVFCSTLDTQNRAGYLSELVVEFMEDSMDWIYSHIEYYGPDTGNHVINNARALVLAGAFLENELAFAVGIKILRVVLPVFILPGGFLRERSTHYQFVVLNWVLDAWRFISAHRGQGSVDARFVLDFAERMALAGRMLLDGNQKMFGMIGDISPDASPAQSLARLGRLYPEYWPVNGRHPASIELRDGWFRISAGNETILGNFPCGQYPVAFPTHGHNDLTSFVWSHNDKLILADSGRYRYTPDSVSLFQKSSLGHNVPLINEFAPLSESLIPNGLWWPVPYARAELEMAECGTGVMLAHNGFARATPVQRHSRKIVPGNGVLHVADAFDGIGEVEVMFLWNFGESFYTFDENRMAAVADFGEVRLSWHGTVALQVHKILGLHGDKWLSVEYGKKQPGLGVWLRGHVTLPTDILTQFSLTVFQKEPTDLGGTAAEYRVQQA